MDTGYIGGKYCTSLISMSSGQSLTLRRAGPWCLQQWIQRTMQYFCYCSLVRSSLSSPNHYIKSHTDFLKCFRWHGVGWLSCKRGRKSKKVFTICYQTGLLAYHDILHIVHPDYWTECTLHGSTTLNQWLCQQYGLAIRHLDSECWNCGLAIRFQCRYTSCSPVCGQFEYFWLLQNFTCSRSPRSGAQATWLCRQNGSSFGWNCRFVWIRTHRICGRFWTTGYSSKLAAGCLSPLIGSQLGIHLPGPYSIS